MSNASIQVTFQRPLDPEYLDPILAKMREMFGKSVECCAVFDVNTAGFDIDVVPIEQQEKFMRWFARTYPSVTYRIDEPECISPGGWWTPANREYHGPEAIEFEITDLRHGVEQANKRIAELRKTLRNRAAV